MHTSPDGPPSHDRDLVGPRGAPWQEGQFCWAMVTQQQQSAVMHVGSLATQYAPGRLLRHTVNISGHRVQIPHKVPVLPYSDSAMTPSKKCTLCPWRRWQLCLIPSSFQWDAVLQCCFRHAERPDALKACFITFLQYTIISHSA
jgi:hypothetical protein